MSELEDLIEKLLAQKPGLTREEVQEQIRLKKDKIGDGYLTDQGALFLIASDNGIELSGPSKTAMGIKELYVGAKDVSLTVGVMGVSPATQLSRKDGTQFYLRTLIVYDADSAVNVKLWDDKANLPGLDDLKPGDLIRITGAYVKSDFDDSPTINVGSGSAVELVTEAETDARIPAIGTMARDVGQLQVGTEYLVVSGTIDGAVDVMEFTNSRGQPRSALKMRLRSGAGDAGEAGDAGGGSGSSRMRVVLWGKDGSAVPDMISQDAKVKLLGVKVRDGNQGPEIHGSEATHIEIEGQGESEPIVARILSVVPAPAATAAAGGQGGARKSMILGTDAKRGLYYISDLSGSADACAEGDVVEIMPSKAHGNSVTLDHGSFVRKLDDDGSVPSLPDIRTKIGDVRNDNSYCIEAIVLKAPERREIQTKAGEVVDLAEMFVEDDTAQTWVKGWRNQARLTDGCEPGDIVSVTALNARPGLDGKTELFLTPFSKIAKKSDTQL